MLVASRSYECMRTAHARRSGGGVRLSRWRCVRGREGTGSAYDPYIGTHDVLEYIRMRGVHNMSVQHPRHMNVILEIETNQECA